MLDNSDWLVAIQREIDLAVKAVLDERDRKEAERFRVPGGALTVMEPVETLRDRFAMAALSGMLAGGMAYDDRTVVGAFAVADRCMKVRSA